MKDISRPHKLLRETSQYITCGKYLRRNSVHVCSRIGSGRKPRVSAVTAGPPTSKPILTPEFPCIGNP